MSEQLPTPKPVEPAAKPRSAQNKKLGNDIVQIGQMIDTGLTDTEAAPTLAEGGYTPEEFKRIKLVQADTRQSFYDQLQAIADQDAATKAFYAADKDFRKLFTLLRGYARNAFPKDTAAKDALGVGGRVPDDLQGLLLAGGNLAEKGVKPEYAAKLAAKTVTAARLGQLQAKIDALIAADRAQNAAITAKPQVTARLTTLSTELFDWASNYRGFVKLRFNELGRPDIAKRLLR